MKKTAFICNILFISVLFSSCKLNMDKESVSLSTPIGPQEINWNSDVLTPEILWSMGRLGEVSVSPDNKQIIYSVSYYSVKHNKSNTAMYIMNVDGSNNKKLTNTNFSEYNIKWRPDSKKIGFLTAESGSMQLWEINPDGTGRKQISDIEGGISGFEYAPDQTKILYSADLKLTKTVKDIYPDLPLSSGRVVNDLMYRHWDHWVDTYSHIFIADYDGKSISNPFDIMEDEKWEAPVRPFGGMEQVRWSPDSKSIVYSSRKLIGKAYAESTNTDLYQYTIETKKTVNLTEGMMGYDLNATFSPDGTLLAWESMEHDGYEADKNRLFILNFETGAKEDYTLNFDQDVQGLSWSADSKKLYFISNHHAEEQIYCLNVPSCEIEKVTDGAFNYTSVHFAGNFLIGVRQSMSNPSEMFKIALYDYSEIVQLTHINTYTIRNLQFGKVEKRWIPTSDGKEMLTWVIYPPNFDPAKKYPALLYCQGGPQSGVSQFWSYRWNFQIMAANDYIIVAPNRRGVPGFGQEWKEQISGDYGGQNMHDYLAAIDAVAKEDFVDENRLGAIGASYGGFSVYWLAGNHENRFKAFIAHDGMFNLEAQYLETEEIFFVEWDLGGPFWDKNNKKAQWSYANSPHKFVQNWNTPILVIHGDKDYRILSSQGFQAYNAALLQDVPAELLFFPDENHWVLKPQNGILWQRRFFNWLDKWLK